MKTLFKAAALAGLLITASAQPALAANGPLVAGIGWINVDAVKVNANAWKVAEQQRPVTYKATIDAANTRAQAIQAQLVPLAQKFERDRAAPTPNQAALQTQYGQIQQLQQAGEEEINRLLAPVQLSRAYVEEQINDQLQKAVDQAVVKRKLTMLVRADAVVYADPAYNMNQAVLDEINVLLPAAQLVPPTGWEPRQMREQRAAAAAAQGGAPAATPAPAGTPAPRPAGPQPDGR
ncbi:MAG TPA: OmpH family outer membrane protein [Novosphingobium sp.]|nr:OmpH family outer membrane protein [Novosphingobium sp.]